MITIGGGLAAIWLGWQIADGAYGLPALAAVIGLAAALVRITRLPADVILLGLLLLGYIVGNRGFAQLIIPVMGFPLLPAELGLAVGAGWLAVQSALARALPVRRDFLNWILLLWLVLGTARVLLDVPRFGFLAIRDYAMVYYAAFFFLAQYYAAEVRARNYLVGCIALAVTVLLPVYLLQEQFPLFFYTVLTVRGVPLIALKGDLAMTFLAAGAVVLFHFTSVRQRPWGWPLATALFLIAMMSNSRATLVGCVVTMGWLVLARRWLFPTIQASVAAVTLAVITMLAFSGVSRWAEARLGVQYDRLASIVDFSGTRDYGSDEILDKGDNNRFRLIWWYTVATETWAAGPVFGLGFGYDLAKKFVRTYNPEMGDDFSARSPHSFVVTTFGRMGATGLGLVLALVGAMAVKTWRSLRDKMADPVVVGLWCAVWIIFTSSCFGVVLEGPMGAVVFWTILGLAN
ncbi:MAG: hypothetical protein A3G75_08205, partial [Verrucomicrobia bacterium RIFCSPLOWO2_12_FULL_64_8]